ncbi:MAG TPA: cytidylate kinase-like family protein [Bacteroidales bacterium]|jgi:cytidylate kinase|nr:cytidylate kinase-like family protein [Bacteroidales bacterium]MDI9574195.1 cytidylate kinase-like family protein [Bacteroidota bacterium]MBP9512217.1 cytidylate kinase-like family protein [Bacteroidales bacterium]MBP9588701.1 cytidylate kinase-like family protein [Bacteroidales bacterium]HOE59021.1 cytidylate kinase-like family protein [Bacteroidales bacterium]
MDEKYYICIGRQIGSGGKKISEKLAQILQLPVYDKELIQMASRKSGLRSEIFEQFDEKGSRSLIGGLLGMSSPIPDEIYAQYYLTNESLFVIESDVIRELAAQKSCIFLGRCADYVLKDCERCLNVFICANYEDRIKTIAETYHYQVNKAKDFIKKMDKKRADYYNYFTNKHWGVADSYHLCINSSTLGIDETVNFIYLFVKKNFGI